MSDKELLELLQGGNHRYFAVFTNRYEQHILTKCKGYVKNKDAAADLCQEILIKVFLQIPKFRNEAKLSTWLYTIIHNTCVDHLRKNKKDVHEVITEKLVDEVLEIVDTDDELSDAKTAEVLDELLEKMTANEKLLLLLKYKEKHSIKDIQLSMGLSESAVKMRLKRAKEKLNKLYTLKLKSPNEAL